MTVPNRTHILNVARSAGAVERAAEILRGGGLVAFPTETVYGLGALGLDAAALERIFVAKGRPHSDPLILHLGEEAWVRDLVQSLPPLAELLMEAFWPGPLTLVLPKSAQVPDLATAGMDSVAVRMPAHPVALELIRRVGQPVAAPSANLFSRPSPTTAAHVLQDLDGRIDAVLDGGPTDVGVESTVLDLRGDEPVILRPGGVTRADLERVLGRPVLELARAEQDAAADQPAASPGLLTRHYSPRAEVFLFDGPDVAAIAAMRRLAEEAKSGTETALLAFTEDIEPLGAVPCTVVDLGSRHHPEEAARGLYAAFRDLDKHGIARVGIRLAPPGGLGDAVNDRLRRAASGRIIRIP
jgi:L-threonylcarbamoyladenylate synthase